MKNRRILFFILLTIQSITIVNAQQSDSMRIELLGNKLDSLNTVLEKLIVKNSESITFLIAKNDSVNVILNGYITKSEVTIITDKLTETINQNKFRAKSCDTRKITGITEKTRR